MNMRGGPRRLDLTYRPEPGALDLRPTPPRPRPKRHASDEPPWADRIIAPRARRRPRFYVDRRGTPHYAGQVLRRRSSGAFCYTGPAGTFRAFIFPDGQIRFKDRQGAALTGLSLVFDLTDAVMRRIKQDPYKDEKLRFTRLSQSYRNALRRRWLAQKQRQTLGRFALAGPWCRAYQARSTAGQARLRRQLFERWDGTAGHVRGAQLKAAVLSIIRRCHIAYPAAELRALNQQRESRARFSPNCNEPR